MAGKRKRKRKVIPLSSLLRAESAFIKKAKEADLLAIAQEVGRDLFKRAKELSASLEDEKRLRESLEQSFRKELGEQFDGE